MRCRDARRLLVMEDVVPYGTPRRGGLARHLSECPRCRETAHHLRNQVSALRAAWDELELREDFLDGLRARIDGDQTPMP